VLGASAVGAPHRRERIWIVATRPDADCRGQSES
jgi:site-specific DNA-cytosine methylase